MKSTIFLIIVFLIQLPVSSFAQKSIRGGEIQVGIDELFVKTSTFIYTEYIPKDSITLDWGDGTSEIIYGNHIPIPETGILKNSFHSAIHTYPNYGTYVISIQDSFWIDDIVNIPNSGGLKLVLKDTITLTDDLNWMNEPPVATTLHTDLYHKENGAIRHTTGSYDPNGDSLLQRLIPFPAPDYSFPEFTDSLKCCVLWDRPTMTGKYAFAIRVSDWRAGVELSSLTRLMVIDVDTVFTTKVTRLDPRLDSYFSLFPNPNAFDKLHIASIEEFQNTSFTLSIYNIFGEQVFAQQDFDLRDEVDVSRLSAGTYILRLQSEEGVLARKFVVQH